MQFFRDLRQEISIILTNDWFAGFAAGYRKSGMFGDSFAVTLLENENDTHSS